MTIVHSARIAGVLGIIMATAFGCSRHQEDRHSASGPGPCAKTTADARSISEMRKELFALLPQQRKEFYQQFLFSENAAFNEIIRKRYEEVESFWNDTERRIDWMPLEYKYEFWDMAYDKIDVEKTRMKQRWGFLKGLLDELDHGENAGEKLALLESSLRKMVSTTKGDRTVSLTPDEMGTKRAFPQLFASVADNGEEVIPRILGIAADYARIVQAQKYPGKRANELEGRVFP